MKLLAARAKLAAAARAGRGLVSCASGARRPLSVACILTHRCNFRCVYCDIPDHADREMSTRQWQQGLTELTAAGLLRASFSGGEALLRPDALEIIGHARRLGLSTSLNSNGWLTDAQLAQLAPLIDVLMVSLDGPAEDHDKARRKPGSQQRALAVLDRARQLGVTTTAITVLTPANLHVIEPVLELAKRHGFWSYFQPAYQGCFDRNRGLDPGLTPQVLADVAARLTGQRRAGLPVGASEGYLQRLAAAPQFGSCTNCHAGQHFFTILPDGACIPCHLTAEERLWPNAADLGFAAAFQQMARPSDGAGCAISPYQEQDLIFGLDRSAIAAALRRLGGQLG